MNRNSLRIRLSLLALLAIAAVLAQLGGARANDPLRGLPSKVAIAPDQLAPVGGESTAVKVHMRDGYGIVGARTSGDSLLVDVDPSDAADVVATLRVDPRVRSAKRAGKGSSVPLA